MEPGPGSLCLSGEDLSFLVRVQFEVVSYWFSGLTYHYGVSFHHAYFHNIAVLWMMKGDPADIWRSRCALLQTVWEICLCCVPQWLLPNFYWYLFPSVAHHAVLQYWLLGYRCHEWGFLDSSTYSLSQSQWAAHSVNILAHNWTGRHIQTLTERATIVVSLTIAWIIIVCHKSSSCVIHVFQIKPVSVTCYNISHLREIINRMADEHRVFPPLSARQTSSRQDNERGT